MKWLFMLRCLLTSWETFENCTLHHKRVHKVHATINLRNDRYHVTITKVGTRSILKKYCTSFEAAETFAHAKMYQMYKEKQK